jgi:two-component system nitrogen regulation sensor histidine kinase GlnL
LLNLFSNPAVILDTDAGNIIASNTRALRLTAYTRSELEQIPYRQIFTDLDLSVPATPLDELRAFNICIRSGNIEPIVIEHLSLDSEHRWVAIIFEPLAKFQKRDRSQRRQRQHMLVLKKMAAALQLSSPEKINESFLEAGHILTGAASLSLYRVDSGGPLLTRVCHLGEEIALPETLAASDLGRTSAPQLWTKGRRIRSGLQRIARAMDLGYLATAGIGDENALSGLLIAADEGGLPDDNLLEILEVLSSLLGNIFQHDVLTAQLRKINLDQDNQLKITEAIRDNVQDGVILLNSELTISTMNPAAELILGYATEEVRGQSIDTVLIGADNLGTALKLGLEGISTPSLGNSSLHRRDGRAFPAEIQITPVSQDEQVTSLIILLRDQSEHYQIKLRTQQLEQRALLGEVTAIFAHEVRNPLNNISIALQLMEMNFTADDPNMELVNRMKQDTERLLHLMDSVLSFSRSADRKLEPVNLNVFLQRLMYRWQPRMARANVRTELHIPEDIPMIRGNEQSLEQVFTNLFSNALRAMSETGGTLSVRVTRGTQDGGQKILKIEVSDTGIGIPPENLESIFTPFFTTDPQGTGLGLAITQRIILAHKGKITVDSFPGGGTVFKIEIPALPGTGSLEGLLD